MLFEICHHLPVEIEGKSHREIADILATSEANSRKLLSRAMAELVKRMM